MKSHLLSPAVHRPANVNRASAWAVERLEPRVLYSTASFLPAVRYAAGLNPRDIAVADFNGDGKPDVVAVDQLNEQVNVILNNGDGTFGPPLHFGAGFVQSVAVADFNHDGKMDLALTSFDGTNGVLLVYFGNGDGTFARKPERIGYLAGGRSIVAADFNGDGLPDVAITTANRVAVFLNEGNGILAKPVYYTVGNDRPTALAVGDFNGDGLPDLAVARGSTGSLNILLNNPAAPGTFGPPTSIPAGSNPLAVTTGDFNGDGKLDLAVTNSAFGQPALSVFLGNGDGTFRPRSTYDTPNFADAVVAGDFSGDGDQDLVVGSFTGSTRLFPGNGDGTFATSVAVPGAPFAEFVRAADLSGNGKLDLISTPAGAVRVSINDTGAVTPPPAGGPLDVTLGGGNPRSDTFTAPDGTSVSITLSGPGSAVLHFSGSTVVSIPHGRGVVFRTALQISGISATGTTAATTLDITTRAGSRTLAVGSIATDGAFGSIIGPGVNLTGALSVPGGTKRISLLSANNGSIAVGPGVGSLELGQVNHETIASSGPIGAMQVALDAGFTLTAPAIGRLSVGRNLHDSTITLTAPYAAAVLDLSAVTARGGIVNTMITSAGSIGAVSAACLVGSTIDAGIGPLAPGERLPAATGDFAAPASIGSVLLGTAPRTASFANSVIAAAAIGVVRLSQIQTANSVPFGVAAHAIGGLSGTDAISRRSFQLFKLTSATDISAVFASRGINPQAFSVRLM